MTRLTTRSIVTALRALCAAVLTLALLVCAIPITHVGHPDAVTHGQHGHEHSQTHGHAHPGEGDADAALTEAEESLFGFQPPTDGHVLHQHLSATEHNPVILPEGLLTTRIFAARAPWVMPALVFDWQQSLYPFERPPRLSDRV